LSLTGLTLNKLIVNNSLSKLAHYKVGGKA